MDYRSVILAALFSCAGVAHAGYAQLAPPERFSGAYPDFKFAPAANDAKFGRVVHQARGLRVPVPGSPVTMPVSYRFAANAPRFAAAAIFVSPHLRAAVGIASMLGLAKIFWDEGEKSWKTTVKDFQDQPHEYTYYIFNMSYSGKTKEEACAHYVSLADPSTVYFNARVSGQSCLVDWYYKQEPDFVRTNQTSINSQQKPCPVGWTSTPAGCTSPEMGKIIKINDEADFVRRILNPDNQPGWPNVPADWPLPETVPFEIPVPLPVEQPKINPDPGPNPQDRPKFVPTGDPVPNPKYDPNAPPSTDNQPWLQPGVRITPRPTPDQPWRVDITPTDRPQAGPEPDPNLDSDPDPGKDKPKPEEQQSLCEKHPDILACQILKDSGDKPEIEKKDFDFDFTPETGFSGSASCPAPVTVNVSGMQLAFSWVPFCNSLSFAKPIILALAWLSAAFIMLGAKEQ